MAKLPAGVDWCAAGIRADDVASARLIHEGHGNRLYRMETARGTFVAKCTGDGAQSHEIRAHALLEELGVPTLPVHGRGRDVLLLEDLESSGEWRLAEVADAEQAEVGAAVAEWYRALHAAGRRLLADPSSVPGFLRREVDTLTPETVLAAARDLGLAAHRVWRPVAQGLDQLLAAYRSLPQTLDYNDFRWTNLALARPGSELRAVVFDYHLLGIGAAASDVRNVLGSLGPAAAAEFRRTYGEVDGREAVLDAPLSALYALQEAAARPEQPGWATTLIREVEDGRLERKLRCALDACR